MPLFARRLRTPVFLFASLCLAGSSFAQEEDRSGRMITIKGVIDTGLSHRVLNAANAAVREGVEVLIFDIQAAQSDFGPCRDLADKITKLGGGVKRTVAYVPQSLTGNAVLVALACQEIVLAEDARIGDVGGDDDVDRTERTAYEEIAGRAGHDRAIVLGMLEKDLRLVEVTTPNGKRILPADQLDAFVRGARVLKQEVIKEAGARLLLNAEQAKRLGLVRRTASHRRDVALAYGLPERIAGEDVLFQEAVQPYLLKIEGAINGRTEQYVLRRLQQAKQRGSNLLFVQIDSRFGEEDTAAKIANALDLWPARKVAWVPPGSQATGPAALLLFGCDELVAAPNAVVGGFRLEKASPDEYAGFARSAGAWIKDSKYPAAVVAGMIDPAVEVLEVAPANQAGVKAFRTADELASPEEKQRWRVIRTVKAKGSPPLELSGEDARSVDLAVATAASQDELQSLYDVPGRVPVLQPGWVDALVDALVSRGGTFFLLVIGMTCLYIEFQVPGFGVAGVISALCFVLFFWSRYFSDTANSLEIAMFLLGLMFLFVELFVLPGFGFTGFTGIALILGSLVLASQSFTVPRTDAEARELVQNVLTLAASMVVFLVASLAAARFLPSMPLFARMVLAPPGQEATLDEDEFDDEAEPAPPHPIAGKTGVAVTPLRPAGRMLLDDRYYDVIAQGSFVEPGASVRVLEVHHNRIVVRAEPA